MSISLNPSTEAVDKLLNTLDKLLNASLFLMMMSTILGMAYIVPRLFPTLLRDDDVKSRDTGAGTAVTLTSPALKYAGKRVCQVIKLRTDQAEEYKTIHSAVWPSVLATLHRAHIADYSIHLLPSPPYPPEPGIAGLLIATFKYVGTDWEGDMKRVGEDEETRRWWKMTDGMQGSFVEGATGSEAGEWWVSCQEVFRFDG